MKTALGVRVLTSDTVESWSGRSQHFDFPENHGFESAPGGTGGLKHIPRGQGVRASAYRFTSGSLTVDYGGIRHADTQNS